MKPKILYAIQCTGNGHVTRANEIIPILKEYCELDVLVSGNNNFISLNHPIKHQFRGLTLFTNKNGKLSFLKIIFKNYFINFLIDIFKLKLTDYELIISDYEPISCWAAMLRSKKCIGLSNQFMYLDNKNVSKFSISKLLLNSFVPVKEHYSFGLKPNNKNILPPVIRKEIAVNKDTKVEKDLYIVYLPSFSNSKLLRKLSKIDVKWHIFSPEVKNSFYIENCSFFPVDNTHFTNSLLKCEGVLTQAGFQLPAEALFLKKKMFVIPIRSHVEQELNAKIMKSMGVVVSKKLDKDKIFLWVNSSKRAKINYDTNMYLYIENILQKHLSEEVIEVKFI